jgi:RimJ/RimL family protein N-acetyltransferase
MYFINNWRKIFLDKIILEKIVDNDIILIEQWLQKEYIRKWYDPIEEWIHELKNRNKEFNFIKHFIVKNNSVKMGFCQYYDCFFAKELWYKVDKQNNTYSIDYLIGEEEYLNKGLGKEIIQKLIERIEEDGGKEIIVQPEKENIKSNKALMANGFEYKEKEKYFYKRIV